MQYFVYNVVWSGALLLALGLLPAWALLGERFRAGLLQRLGFYGVELPRTLAERGPVWIHAASVGEVTAAARLSAALKERQPHRAILLSAFTATGRRMAASVASADAAVFLPLDHVWIVRRALARFRPSLLIILETEIWPNLLREAYRNGTPTLLVSARVSERAFRRYTRFAFFFRNVMRYLTAAGAQTAQDAERLIRLGAEPDRVSVLGNLKRAPGAAGAMSAPEPEARPDESVPHAPLLVAGSSHRGEEEILAAVFTRLKQCFPALRMVLAPRHPERFAEVEKLLSARGISFDVRSACGPGVDFSRAVLLLDTMGELERFYAMADVAFVGGSLVDVGGHNLLEPARYGKPVLFGPFMSNFQVLAEEMKRTGGAIEVHDADELAEAVAGLLRDPARRRVVGEKAHRFANQDTGVLQRSVALAERYLQG